MYRLNDILPEMISIVFDSVQILHQKLLIIPNNFHIRWIFPFEATKFRLNLKTRVDMHLQTFPLDHERTFQIVAFAKVLAPLCF